jgi:hypothetical protein
MSESQKTVFISCGQSTDKERELGQRVCALVEKLTPFEGYFAQNQSTASNERSRIDARCRWRTEVIRLRGFDERLVYV